MRSAPALAAIMVAAAVPAGAQLTFRISVPSGTPDTAVVYVAGTFNGWNPANPAYRLTRGADGVYTLTVPHTGAGAVEFKFTMGSWELAEATGAGADVPNRRFEVAAGGPSVYAGEIAAWRDGRPRPPRASTARPTVSVLSDTFAIPELGVTRRVWIYLPPNYETSGRRYPVLYMHDGQNVFDDATSYSGEWGVDETLDSLHAAGDAGVIVVAVDHGGQSRIDEYSPWRNERYGGGRGDQYVDFLATRLKPYVDEHYRTLPGRAHTGVAGSSMGGLISLYAALRHPDVFGRAGVFSPAFWVAPEFFTYARDAARARPDTRFYFVTGAREGSDPEVYVRDHQRMVDTLRAAGFSEAALEAHVRADGTHSESFWRREFPEVYRWLFSAGPARD